MSLKWKLVSTCVYVEAFLVILILLRIISAQSWKKFFDLFSSLSEYKSYILFGTIGVPVMFYLSDFKIYWHQHDLESKVDRYKYPLADEFLHAKIFYAERNMMMSAAMFILSITLWRLITIMSKQASLTANEQANLRQAQGASDEAARLRLEIDALKKHRQSDQSNAPDKTQLDTVGVEDELVVGYELVEDELTTIQLELKDAQEELKRVQKELKRTKKSSEDTSFEYDRLIKDVAELKKILQRKQQHEE